MERKTKITVNQVVSKMYLVTKNPKDPKTQCEDNEIKNVKNIFILKKGNKGVKIH